MPGQSWLAPAKLNLFLHITARRADGYHELQTLFQLLNFGDVLSFSVNESGSVTRATEIAGLAAADDITVKAARALQAKTGCRKGVCISIEKRIPMGGGLGGGSSDAATTLLALNHLWALGLSRARLAEIGLGLGADVPVFVHGESAWAEGVGEKLTPVELPPSWYLVIIPSVHASTAQLFADSELTRDARPIKIRDYFAGSTGNVFEPIARKHFPAIAEALDWLSARAGRPAKLSGTGASVFAQFSSEHTVKEIAAQVPQQWQRFVAQGINQSPVLTDLLAWR